MIYAQLKNVLLHVISCIVCFTMFDGIYGIGDPIVLNIFTILTERFSRFLKAINNPRIKMMLL